MTPFEIFVTSMAYIMCGDGDVSAEERAKLLGAINKHVRKKEIMPDHLKKIVQTAFQIAKKTDLEHFLATSVEELTPGQRLSIFANLYDMTLADGDMVSGEKAILDRFRGIYDIDLNTARALEEVIMLKNDTQIFTSMNHPANEPNFKLKVKYERD